MSINMWLLLCKCSRWQNVYSYISEPVRGAGYANVDMWCIIVPRLSNIEDSGVDASLAVHTVFMVIKKNKQTSTNFYKCSRRGVFIRVGLLYIYLGPTTLRVSSIHTHQNTHITWQLSHTGRRCNKQGGDTWLLSTKYFWTFLQYMSYSPQEKRRGCRQRLSWERTAAKLSANCCFKIL